MAQFPVKLIQIKKKDCVFESLFQYKDDTHSEYMNLFEIDLSRYKCKKSVWIKFWDWNCHPEGKPLYKFSSHTVTFKVQTYTYYCKVEITDEEESGECLDLTFNCKVWARGLTNPLNPVSGGGKGKFLIGGIDLSFSEAPDLSLDFVIQICCKDKDDIPKETPQTTPEPPFPGTTGHTGPRPEFHDVDPESGCYKECNVIAPPSLAT